MRYHRAMGKRTSLIVEPDLLKEAAGVLGTKGPTATVREALKQAVRKPHLQSLAGWELPEDAPAQLEKLREPRSFGSD
jgi:Arc/MetJ family transcription regulator